MLHIQNPEPRLAQNIRLAAFLLNNSWLAIGVPGLPRMLVNIAFFVRNRGQGSRLGVLPLLERGQVECLFVLSLFDHFIYAYILILRVLLPQIPLNIVIMALVRILA